MSNGGCIVDGDIDVDVVIEVSISGDGAISSGEVCCVISNAGGVINRFEGSTDALDLSNGGCVVDFDNNVGVGISSGICSESAISSGEVC